LNTWPEEEVGKILRDYGEESNWCSLQRKIVHARTSGGLHSTAELVKLIQSTSSGSGGKQLEFLQPLFSYSQKNI